MGDCRLAVTDSHNFNREQDTGPGSALIKEKSPGSAYAGEEGHKFLGILTHGDHYLPKGASSRGA
jgi:hypothetical protein